jgi:glycosyltransferase involved in cell wall biosynthesis
LKVCLISNQIAAWGKIGGFGTATRALGRGLAAGGVEVAAAVPRRKSQGQSALEQLDGMTVHGISALSTMVSGRVFRDIGADIYHSQEPTIASWHAMRAVPEAVHIVTCRDPRSFRAHLVELKHTNYKRRLIAPATWLYEMSPMVKSVVRRADRVLMPAPSHLVPRIKELYGQNVDPVFVPSPVDLPNHEPVKNPEPLALFVGRWDHRKRIEWFFELARRLPEVRFVAVGRAHDDAYDRKLREEYGGLGNIEMPGFLPKFGETTLDDLYERAWVLVNTSVREGLPYTFLEAGAWNCAIASTVDAEGFASRFGYSSENGTLDDLKTGLHDLIETGDWRTKGQAAGAYIRSTWSEDESLRRHRAEYEDALRRRRSR